MPASRIALIVALFLMPAALAQNIVTNPSAEAIDDKGAPVGWSRYVGAGKCDLSSSDQAPHSGQRCACLKMTEWYAKEDKDGKKPPSRSINCGVIVGDSDGYHGDKAFPAQPGQTYIFTLWIKGDVPRVQISALTWNTEAADPASRQHVGVDRFAPGPEWRQFGGRFHMPDDAKRFVLCVYASGKEEDGWKLGTLWVDDATVQPAPVLGQELRAIWYGSIRARTEEEGMKEIRDSISQIKAAGFNAIFASESTLYLAALKDEKYQEAVPQAKWDAMGKLLQEAKTAGVQVHLWFSPWIYKNKYRSVELREHPEWAAVRLDGTPSAEGVCAARPDVRDFELQAILGFLDRYPQLDGVHLEEPGYPWGDYCFCDHCRRQGKELFGFDFKDRPADPALGHFKAMVCNDLVFRLRREMLCRAPQMLLSYNGSAGDDPDWYIGRDWVTLARFGAIDFYVPQVYTTSTVEFSKRLQDTIAAAAGRCKVCAGLAITYSGIYPKRNTPEELAGQIAAARKASAAGVVVFCRTHLTETELPALSKALKGE